MAQETTGEPTPPIDGACAFGLRFLLGPSAKRTTDQENAGLAGFEPATHGPGNLLLFRKPLR